MIVSILRALKRAEAFAKEHPQQGMHIIAEKLHMQISDMTALWPVLDLRLSLDHTLLISLENEARWAIKHHLTEYTDVPDYLDLLYPDGLVAVKPETITLIR